MKQEFAEGNLRERFNNAAGLRMAGVTGQGKDNYAPDLRNDDYGDGGAAVTAPPQGLWLKKRRVDRALRRFSTRDTILPRIATQMNGFRPKKLIGWFSTPSFV
ncbi:hypothetical protein [Sinorhizobium meliloti]|uniref:hypothetical protein n=1 Tax=Rhizobium meliloti TaxID=382 RepID=UPI00038267EB|nr:hypothetical protein [Sinorhizobium meliloti]